MYKTLGLACAVWLLAAAPSASAQEVAAEVDTSISLRELFTLSPESDDSSMVDWEVTPAGCTECSDDCCGCDSCCDDCGCCGCGDGCGCGDCCGCGSGCPLLGGLDRNSPLTVWLFAAPTYVSDGTGSRSYPFANLRTGQTRRKNWLDPTSPDRRDSQSAEHLLCLGTESCRRYG